MTPRQVLRALFDSAIASAQPDLCVPPHLPQPPKGRTVVVGVGKAAVAMAKAVEAHYPAPVSGVVVCPYGAAEPTRDIRVLQAAHPIADANSVSAARAILDAVSGLGADDLVIALISGGGSALAALPVEGVTLDEKQTLVRGLMSAGAPIGELNAVRVALSRFKGGGLARAIGHARCVALIISDVVGDDPAMIASGPTIRAAIDARAVLDIVARRNVQAASSIISYLEGLERQDDARIVGQDCCGDTSRVETRMIATPAMALEAAARRARALGLEPHILGDTIEGTPADAARLHLHHAAQLGPGQLLLSGGELTTVVRGPGRGGPNLEFGLELVAQGLPAPLWALAGDTDGRDGNSGVAGAIITPDSMLRGRARGMNPLTSLAASASFDYFAALEDLVDPGWTGTNVNDFRVVARF